MAYVPPLNGGRINASIGGNTAGASTLVSTGTMVLAGGNNVTLSQNGNTISFNAASAAAASVNFSAGTTSANLASVTFANSNGVNFGLSAGTITASHNGITLQSAQTQSNIQAIYGGTVAATASTGTVAFANSNGVSFGMNGNTMTASVAAAAAGSNTLGMSNLGNASGTTGTVAGSALQYVFAGGNNVTLSQSLNGASGTLSINAQSQSIQSQNLVSINGSTGNISFTTGGNVSFGGAGSAMTASYSQTNQTLGLYAGGNTTGQTSTTSVDARSLSFDGLGNVSVGYSNGSVQISGAGGGGGGVALYDGAVSISSGTVSLQDGNNVSFGLAGQTLTASVPAISSLVGVNGITISTAGSTISISGNGAGAAGGTVGNWEPIQLQAIQLGSTAMSATNLNTVYFNKLQPTGNVSATQLMQLMSMNATTSSNATYSGAISLYAGLYSVNASTLSLITGSSGSTFYSWSVSSSAGSANLNGIRGLPIPMTANMSAGNYWLGVMSRTTFGTIQGFTMSHLYASSNTSFVYSGVMGQAANATQGAQEGVGYYSSSSTALPTAAPMSSIIQSNLRSYIMPYIAFKNSTW